MALSVTVRKLDPVVFPGDLFRCIIEFKNNHHPSSGTGFDNEKVETLAWASAQLYGQYVADPTLLKLPSSTKQRLQVGSTLPKFDDNSRLMYSSNAELLACDMKLKPGESQTYYYTCTIPTDSLPPSYRGTSIKYSNIFSLVLQKSASTHSGPPLVLTLPFKLMNPTSGLRRNEFQLGCPSFKFATSALPLPASHNFNSADFQSSDSSKPIKEKETRRIVKSVFEKFGKPVCIKVNKGVEHLAQVTVEKTAYQLGDAVRGYIDFSNATVGNYFLSVKLDLIEDVASEHFANTPGRPSGTSTKTVAEYEEAIHDTNATNFEFHLPINATPTFATELVSVRWVLKFELIASTIHRNPDTSSADLTIHRDKSEKMSWQIPIRVFVASYPFSLLDPSTSQPSKTWMC